MSDESGFCCRCGKETNRKEQVGLIVAWTCSTSCAHQASMMYARPSLPELDKLSAARPFLRVMEEFLDWLNLEEQGIALCTYRQPQSPLRSGYWSPTDDTARDVLGRFFNVDMEKVEEEKRKLEQLVIDFQQSASRQGPE
jgi:hypothetical protein